MAKYKVFAYNIPYSMHKVHAYNKNITYKVLAYNIKYKYIIYNIVIYNI